MERRNFLKQATAGIILFSGISSYTYADPETTSGSAPKRRFYSFTAPAIIETSPDDGGERLIISNGERTFQFFYASHDTGRRLSPYPFILESGKSYTFTIEERADEVAKGNDDEVGERGKSTKHLDYFILVRVKDGNHSIFDLEICGVHQCQMDYTEVPIIYGRMVPIKTRPSEEVRLKLFPHYRESIVGGCIVRPGRKTEGIYICPKCKLAFEEWKNEHPQ